MKEVKKIKEKRKKKQELMHFKFKKYQ